LPTREDRSAQSEYNPGVAILRKTVIFLIAASVGYVFFINVCDLLFQCGCQFLWAGAGQLCNVHMPGAAHCPFCSHGAWGLWLPKVAIWSVQAAVVFPGGKLSDRTLLLLSLVSFPIVEALVGWSAAVYSDYPTFLFFKLF